MKLVIAEKPSAAQAIAKVLGAAIRKDGCLVGSGYIVSWCVGHLVELAQADAYNEKYAQWTYEDLPIVPEHWQYAVPKYKAKQLNVLRGLMADKEVDTIVCATDAGREGELIFRLVYDSCQCKKPVQRLWISSMEESAIVKGFKTLRRGSDYENLYQAALCRSQADWLVGINATRLFSVLYRRTLNIGRVMTPILAMIVHREAAIDAFTPEPFYTVHLDCGSFTATGDKLKEKSTAESFCSACAGNDALVKAVERRDKSERPPKLYDLTSLQRDANRLLGFTAQQTLDYTQSLYEKKLVTYPRTDSRYLTEDMAAGLPALAASVACALPFAKGLFISTNAGPVVDSSKVSDHHAIIPTTTMSKADISSLPAGESSILSLIAARLLCAVADKHQYAETIVTLDCGGHAFTAKGKMVTAPGWKAIDRAFYTFLTGKADEEKTAVLPELIKGQTIPAKASIRESKTTPPKHYTEDTLLSAMETAGAEDMPEDAERKGLGTPATRAGILERLVKTELVERSGDKKTKFLLPTPKGVNLITVAPEEIASPLLTAEWEQKLKLVERGQLPASDFMAGITKQTADLVERYASIRQEVDTTAFQPERQSIGKCPRCGGPVVEIVKGFVCDNRSCGFALWKDSRFFAAKKKALTKQLAAALLKDGRVKLTGCHSEKTGKSYDATVLLDDMAGKYVNFKLEFH